jgi:1-acyl-sn-glycerol-3-phosphate acyltransferase
VARRKLGWAFGFCVFVLRRPLLLLTRREWRGGEHIPRSGGCVVVTNHVSEFDPVPFGHFVYDHGRVPRFLGKAEVFRVPVVGSILRNAGQIPVDRMTSDAEKAFSAAVAAVRLGECIVVYVEGTITRDPGLWPMVGKTGAARIALTTGCPVIPVAQWGPQDVLAPYGRRPRLLPRKLMQMTAGPPVELSSLQGGEPTPAALHEATDRIVADITSLLEVIRQVQAPPVRFDPRKAGVAEIGNPNRPSRRAVEPDGGTS